MGEGFQFFDIILLALIAGFLVFRLRGVLGRRDGHEGRPGGPFSTSSNSGQSNEKVVRLPDRPDAPTDAAPNTPDAAPPETPTSTADGPLEAGLTQIRIADESFSPDEFVSGARIAFEMVLAAYSEGDREKLQGLLSDEVLANFDQSITERETNDETVDITLVGFNSVELVEAYMAGRTAHVTVKFASQQINVLRDSGGEIIDGDPTEVQDVVDFWTFARDTRSGDPNWTLVATGSLE
jgi:predicted lipid-binding transport protein (Tim44 family)